MELEINNVIFDKFTLYLIWLFEKQAKYFDLYNDKATLDSFVLFEFPFDKPMNIYETENAINIARERLIDFPKKNHIIIDDSYCILSILPVPFDAVEITHGMITNFFTPILN
jgi:hypothetical protein